MRFAAAQGANRRLPPFSAPGRTRTRAPLCIDFADNCLKYSAIPRTRPDILPAGCLALSGELPPKER